MLYCTHSIKLSTVFLPHLFCYALSFFLSLSLSLSLTCVILITEIVHFCIGNNYQLVTIIYSILMLLLCFVYMPFLLFLVNILIYLQFQFSIPFSCTSFKRLILPTKSVFSIHQYMDAIKGQHTQCPVTGNILFVR